MSQYYRLDGKVVVPVDTVEEWVVNFETDRRVALTYVAADITVSTIFLGIDHGYSGGPPLVFETLIQGGTHDQDMRRCATWEEAEEQHLMMVLLAMPTEK